MNTETFRNRPAVKVRRPCGGAPKATEHDKALSLFLCRLDGLRRRNKERFGFFSIDFDENYLLELYKKQNGRCIYTGTKFIVETKHYIKKLGLQWNHDLISIDRIDSSKPYQVGNIQFVTSRFNKIKQDLSNAELFHLFCSVFKNMFRYYGLLSKIASVR